MEPAAAAVAAAISGQHLRSVTSRRTVGKARFEWVVKHFLLDFASLSFGEKLCSNTFAVAVKKESVKFRLYSQKTSDGSQEYFGIYLELVDAERNNVWVEFKLAALKSDKNSEWKPCLPATHKFSGASADWGITQMFTIDELRSVNKEVLPQVHLTVICDLKVSIGGSAVTHSPVENVPSSFTSGPNLSARLVSLKISSPDHYADVTLMCEGVPFPCHKVIIAASCDVFKAMFDNKEFVEGQEDKIVVKDIRKEVMSTFIQSFYSDSVCIADDQTCLELMSAAEKYHFTALKISCEQRMAKTLSVENAASVLSWAMACNADNLVKMTKEYVKEHAAEIIETAGFDTFMNVFKEEQENHDTPNAAKKIKLDTLEK